MNRRVLLWIPIVILIAATGLIAAELKPAAVFSNQMVLQRQKPVPVWGWGDPGERVHVEFGGQSKSTTADTTGKWFVRLDPMPANSTPQTLTIKSELPNRSRVCTDVLVGEVWLGSGQSNMAMTVARARDYDVEQTTANLPLVRMFTENSGAAAAPQTGGRGSWTPCSATTVGTFSATLYFFGRELHHQLQVPIGLIHSSVGGTPIESWIAAEAQSKSPELRESFEETTQASARFDAAEAEAKYEKALARWKEQVSAAKESGRTPPRRPINPVEQRNRRGGPGGLFNGKIAPLIPYSIRGVIWYQGEANSQPGKGRLYQYQLPLLVSDWRGRWDEELPFAWVQLPNFRRDGDGWMLVREAMLKSLQLPKTGMAITVDIGESNDIHPKNKQDVGRRLAFWALGAVYAQPGVATSGPLPAGYEVRGRQVVCTFTHCDSGLQARGGELTGFSIAGEDRQWKPAKAVIQGNQVLVSHAEIERPVAVRYAWQADPQCNLVNGARLPASPFRTDNWSQ